MMRNPPSIDILVKIIDEAPLDATFSIFEPPEGSYRYIPNISKLMSLGLIESTSSFHFKRNSNITENFYEEYLSRKISYSENPRRMEDIVKCRANHESYQFIGEKFGISRERVRQLLQTQGVDGRIPLRKLRPPDHFSFSEAHEYLAISSSRLRQYMTQNDISHFSKGNNGRSTLFFEKTELDRFSKDILYNYRKRGRPNDSLKALVFKLFELGVSASEITKISGMSCISIYNWQRYFRESEKEDPNMKIISVDKKDVPGNISSSGERYHNRWQTVFRELQVRPEKALHLIPEEFEDIQTLAKSLRASSYKYLDAEERNRFHVSTTENRIWVWFGTKKRLTEDMIQRKSEDT